ncbi:FAD-binding protein [Paracoccus sp. S-4012]|nr:FAD-binding protein [Paracoccus sp. S-4012]
MLDCLIVGGGPAGLTAAIYLSRFHRRVAVVDKGEGRLAMIPRTMNHAGYPGGVRGCDLLAAMRAQAVEFGAALLDGEVAGLSGTEDAFEAETDLGPIRARTVLLATGVVNLRPPLDAETHAAAVAAGKLRYCPICDAFEQTGKRIGILGADSHGVAEALFLRSYSDDLVMLTLQQAELDAGDRANIGRAGIEVVRTPVSGFDFEGEGVRVLLADGESVAADTLYAALGSETRNQLGEMLGTRLDGSACFWTDERMRTSVKGVYAAGDAIEGLDQISMAMGTAAQAAVTIHNDLRDRDGATDEGQAAGDAAWEEAPD